MNIWGFTPSMFGYARTYFEEFIQEKGHELKSEFYIPSVAGRTVEEEGASVKVLSTDSQWFGVTYIEDKPIVMAQLKKLAEAGTYPSPLWS